MNSMSIVLVPFAILGWAAGLFINYAADVLPRLRQFGQPICHNCEQPYTWADYLMLRSCRSCGSSRSLRTITVQILTTALFLYFAINPPRSLNLPLTLLVVTYFAILVVIDLEHRLILFSTSLFGAALGLLVGTVIYTQALKLPLLSALGSSLLGGVIGFGVMFLFYQLGRLFNRYRARRLQSVDQDDEDEEALGGGDVYLGGVLGLMLGYRFILSALVYGILIGGVAGLVLLVIFQLNAARRQPLMTFIPYGPFLIAGAVYVLFLN
jgi:prepilin signal peptidase PulO-like enzyme (type II secretory pathway)